MGSKKEKEEEKSVFDIIGEGLVEGLEGFGSLFSGSNFSKEALAKLAREQRKKEKNNKNKGGYIGKSRTGHTDYRFNKGGMVMSSTNKMKKK